MTTKEQYEKLAGIFAFCSLKSTMKDYDEDDDINFIMTIISFLFKKGDVFGKESMVELIFELRYDSLNYFDYMSQTKCEKRKLIDLVELWDKYKENDNFIRLLEKLNF